MIERAPKIEEEYYYWDKVKHLKDDKIHLFKTNIAPDQLLWFITKTRRDIINTTDYVFSDLLEDDSFYIEYKFNINEFFQKKL